MSWFNLAVVMAMTLSLALLAYRNTGHFKSKLDLSSLPAHTELIYPQVNYTLRHEQWLSDLHQNTSFLASTASYCFDLFCYSLPDPPTLYSHHPQFHKAVASNPSITRFMPPSMEWMEHSMVFTQGQEYEEQRNGFRPFWKKSNLEALQQVMKQPMELIRYKQHEIQLDSRGLELVLFRHLFGQFMLIMTNVPLSKMYPSFPTLTLAQIYQNLHSLVQFDMTSITLGKLIPPRFRHVLYAREKRDALRFWRSWFEKAAELRANSNETYSYSCMLDAWIPKETRTISDLVFQQILTMLLASHDNTRIVSTWILYGLSRNQEIQESLRNSFSNEENIDHNALLQLCVEEGLRIGNMQPLLIRRAESDTLLEMDEYVVPVPKGTMFYDLSDSYPPLQSFEFDPVANKDNDLPITFGVGRRACPGRRMALLQVKHILYQIISHFKVTVIEESQMKRGWPEIVNRFLAAEPIVQQWQLIQL